MNKCFNNVFLIKSDFNTSEKFKDFNLLSKNNFLFLNKAYLF